MYEAHGRYRKWAKNINGSSIFRNLDIYEDSLEVLYDLSKMGHEIVIISSKPWWSIHDTLMWLGEKKIPTKEIHFIEDKWKIDCDVYIDDAPYQLDNYVKNVNYRTHLARKSKSKQFRMENVRKKRRFSQLCFYDNLKKFKMKFYML